jgi:FkbM family methyltransferase
MVSHALQCPRFYSKPGNQCAMKAPSAFSQWQGRLSDFIGRRIENLLRRRGALPHGSFDAFYADYEYNHLPTILLAYINQFHPEGILKPENLHLCRSTGGQEIFVCGFFRNKRHGSFLELGALDGLFASNTYFLEQALDWRGILIEADPLHLPALRRNRPRARVHQACILDREAELEFNANQMGGGGLIDYYEESRKTNLDIIRLKTRRLQDLLDEDGVRHLDYLSLDVEGSELAVLRSIDFQRTDITLIGVEVLAADDIPAMYAFLTAKGYRMVTRGRLNKVRARDLFFATAAYTEQHDIKTYALHEIQREEW